MSITPPAPDDPFGGLTASGRVTPEAAARDQRPDPPSGAGPRAERWPVPLLLLLTVVGIVFGFSRTDFSDAGSVVTVDGRTVTIAPEDVGDVGDGGPLWTPANLKVAFASMRAKAGNAERVTSLRVDTDYLVAEFARGKERIYVHAHRDGRVDRLSTRIGNPGDKAIGTGRVDPTAPDRIARRIAELAGVEPARVDYLVLTPGSGEESQWLGFLDQEADYDAQLNPFRARLDGSGVTAHGPKARPR